MTETTAKSRPKSRRRRRRNRPLYRLIRAIGAGLGACASILGRGLATGWRLLGALDAALWHGFRHIVASLWRGGVTLLTAMAGGVLDFLAWLPTRAGRAYAALSGFALVIASLWIIDELRSQPQTALRGQDQQASAPLDEKDPILARMGGKYIHLSEIEAAARAAGQLRDEDILTPRSAVQRGLVEKYVEQRLLAAAALEADFHKTPDVARRIRVARDRILAASLLRARINEAVTPETIEALYKETADVTVLGDEVRARHILVETYDDALAILAALDGGADFTVLAREQSLDRATAPLGGEIGYFSRDMMAPTLARAAFAAEPGVIAPPFRTERGWHVLQVVDRRPTQSVRLEAVRDNIEQFLSERTIENILAELRRNAEVVYYATEQEPAPPQEAISAGESGASEDGASQR